jgi:hypothetical protein
MNTLGLLALYLVRTIAVLGLIVSPYLVSFFLDRLIKATKTHLEILYCAAWLSSCFLAGRSVCIIVSYVIAHITFA